MTYALLHYEDSTLPPEARWLLWQWARCIGLDQTVACSVRELLKRLAMSSRQGQPALNVLKEKGAIIATSNPVGRGRPSYEYRLAPALLDHLAEKASPEPVLAANIDHLGDPANDLDGAAAGNEGSEQPCDDASPATNLFDGATRRARMTPANRWVLMVLLAHANENGTVMDIPDERLQSLAGLTSNRWLSQRRKLHDLGVLARYQSGRTERWKGRALPVVHHLNLGHPCLNRPSKPVVQIELLPSSTLETDMSPTDASVTALLMAAHSHRDPVQQDRYRRATTLLPARQYTATEWAVVRTLPNTYGVMAWLRGHVHRAVTQLLNTAWDDIRGRHAAIETPVGSVVEGLEQALNHPLITLGAEALQAQRDAEQDAMTSPAEDGEPPLPPSASEDYRATWVRLLYALAYDLARNRQKDVSSSRELLSERALDPSRLTYSLVAVATPPDRERLTGREMRYWRLYGYTDQHDDAKAPSEPPVVIGVRESLL